jgi:hypothetical protein
MRHTMLSVVDDINPALWDLGTGSEQLRQGFLWLRAGLSAAQFLSLYS